MYMYIYIYIYYVYIYIYLYIYIYQIGYCMLTGVCYINYIALAIDPFLDPCYCLSIAYRLPLMPTCSAILARARARAHGPKRAATRAIDRQSIGNRQAIDRQQQRPNKGSIARAMILIYNTLCNIPQTDLSVGVLTVSYQGP